MSLPTFDLMLKQELDRLVPHVSAKDDWRDLIRVTDGRALAEGVPGCDEADRARLPRTAGVSGHRHLAQRSRSFRVLIAALASAIVVAALAAGIYEAVTHIGGGTPVVIITDGSMSPGGPGSSGERPDGGSPEKVDVTVPVSRDVLEIRFLDLWEQLTAAAGVDPTDARLTNFKLTFHYPSDILATFDLQTQTRDGYSLGVSYSQSAGRLSMRGNRLPDFIPSPGPVPSVDALLHALDVVGVQSLLARLDIPKTPETGTALGDDATGVEMHLADRGDQGVTQIGAQARAYYYEAGTWVELGRDDARRTADKKDIVLVLRKTREDPTQVNADDYASFVVPAETATVGSLSKDAPEQAGPSTSRSFFTNPIAPEEITFETFTQRFDGLLYQKSLAGTLPDMPMPEEELSWFREAARPLLVTDILGYRLANGDLAVLFFTSPGFFTATKSEQSTLFPAANESLSATVQQSYPTAGKLLIVQADFGYVILSKDYGYELKQLADSARLGLTPQWPTNSLGMSYGSSANALSPQDEPDLIQAKATNGKEGYVRRSDLEEPTPKSPEEALARQAERAGKTRLIPVYEVDGITQIGIFEVGG